MAKVTAATALRDALRQADESIKLAERASKAVASDRDAANNKARRDAGRSAREALKLLKASRKKLASAIGDQSVARPRPLMFAKRKK